MTDWTPGSHIHLAPAENGAGSRSGDSGVANPTWRGIRADDRSDEQLLEAHLNGDRAAFQTLVERYQRELYHFLVRFLGDRAAAEDVFQESFLQVHQSGSQFDLSRRFRPWLFTIAANKARDLMRSQARRPTSPLQAEISPGEGEGGQFIDLMSAEIPSPDEPLSREELQQAVQATVMDMPDHLREILLLSYFHQFPYKQIADILDIPLGTVKSRLHAAVATFADRWKKQAARLDGGLGSGQREADAESRRAEGRPAPSSLAGGRSKPGSGEGPRQGSGKRSDAVSR
jgi:RNA polymerase sigma-70 factor (ECF subfamily)